MVSCWRWILSVMSSSSRPMEGSSRVMEGDRPQRTRAGHTCPTQSQSLALARQTPLCTASRQYRAPWAAETRTDTQDKDTGRIILYVVPVSRGASQHAIVDFVPVSHWYFCLVDHLLPSGKIFHFVSCESGSSPWLDPLLNLLLNSDCPITA